MTHPTTPRQRWMLPPAMTSVMASCVVEAPPLHVLDRAPTTTIAELCDALRSNGRRA